ARSCRDSLCQLRSVRGSVGRADILSGLITAGWSVGHAPAFEFLVENALYGGRASAGDWPPRYAAWSG
ncbi:MAG TPA: hypothetical protein VFC81_02195, partial [Verrucomicrobiae bacterium]|nr:hypothetical protein [Verrucomicrobiae bacterium]